MMRRSLKKQFNRLFYENGMKTEKSAFKPLCLHIPDIVKATLKNKKKTQEEKAISTRAFAGQIQIGMVWSQVDEDVTKKRFFFLFY